MSESGTPTSAVASEDITALATRLADWGESLPPAQKSLAQLLVQQMRDLRPVDVRRQQLVSDLGDAARVVVGSLNERWRDVSEGWVEIGPIWQKANRVELGEEVEIIQRVVTRSQR